MSFREYDSYHDSGSEWMGAIPAHWRTHRLRRLVQIEKRIAGFEGPDVLSITQRGIKIRDVESNDGQLAESYAHYQLVNVGDFAMNHMDLLTGWVDLAKQEGVTSPDYRVFALRPGKDIEARYLLRVLQNAYSRRIFYAYGQGSSHLGRWRLPTDAFNDFVVPCPPLSEQGEIADFLDRETAKIDALVEEQRRFVEQLKEKRQVLIADAISNGLNPRVPKKASGVPWLGDVPAHWDVKPLKFVTKFQSGGTPSKEREEYWNGEIPWASAKDLKCEVLADTEEHITNQALLDGAAQLVGVGSVLVLVRGMMLARVFPVCETAVPMAINQDLKALTPKKGMHASFLAWALRGTQQETLNRLDAAGHGTKALRMDTWASMGVPVPPMAEQEDIVTYLKRETARCDELEAISKAAINLLVERRRALISAAVTGKIDVRGKGVPGRFRFDRTRARTLVGAAIIEALVQKPNSGRTKTHKLVYLAETHAGVHELGGTYEREAAGPLDVSLINEMESELQKVGHVSVEQPGGRGSQVTYKVRGKRGALRNELEAALGPRGKVLDKLMADLGELDTKNVEAVATLYAVWNDALLEGRKPSDAAIVDGVLDDWHPEKRRKFNAQQLHIWLGWMRRHGLVPEGRAPKTTRGRLFA